MDRAGPARLKTVESPLQKYPEACVWQPTSNLLVLFKFFVGYSFLVRIVRLREEKEALARGAAAAAGRGDVRDPAGGARAGGRRAGRRGRADGAVDVAAAEAVPSRRDGRALTLAPATEHTA